MSIPEYRIDRHSLYSHRLSGSSPDQSLLNTKGVDTMPKVEIKKVQEHYELYVNQTFMCSCDTNELNSSIAEAYQLYYESITKTH